MSGVLNFKAKLKPRNKIGILLGQILTTVVHSLSFRSLGDLGYDIGLFHLKFC